MEDADAGAESGALLAQGKPRRASCLPRGLCTAGLVLCSASLLAVLIAGAAGGAGHQALAPPCPLTLRVERDSAARDSCVLHYEDPSQELKCLYLESEANLGPCAFNATSALACSWPRTTRLSLVPRPSCSAAAQAGQAGGSWGLPRQRALRAAARPLLPQPPAASTRRAHPTAAGTWSRPLPPPGGGWGGGWQPSSVFRPAAGEACPAAAVSSAAELVAWARATGIRRIVMSGDSTMRQFFNRVITLARTEPVTVDVVSQRYAHYELRSLSGSGFGGGSGSSRGGSSGRSGSGTGGGAARAPAPLLLRDALWFSENAFPGDLRNDEAAVAARLQEVHQQLLGVTPRGVLGEAAGASTAQAAGAAGVASGTGPGAAAGAGSGSVDSGGGEVGQLDLVVDLVMGTLWQWQAANVRAYMRDVLGGGGEAAEAAAPEEARRQTVLVLSACYWHMKQQRDARLWPGYREFLWEMRAAARHVVLVTCPLPPGLPRPGVLAARNRELAAAAAADAHGVLRLLDAALLVASAPEGATIRPQSFHYQCTFYHTANSSLGGESQGPVAYPHVDGSVGRFDAVKATHDGLCEDAVNFSLWQALLALLTC